MAPVQAPEQDHAEEPEEADDARHVRAAAWGSALASCGASRCNLRCRFSGGTGHVGLPGGGARSVLVQVQRQGGSSVPEGRPPEGTARSSLRGCGGDAGSTQLYPRFVGCVADQIIKRDDENWWTAEDKKGNRGQIPVNYVKMVKEYPATNGAAAAAAAEVDSDESDDHGKSAKKEKEKEKDKKKARHRPLSTAARCAAASMVAHAPFARRGRRRAPRPRPRLRRRRRRNERRSGSGRRSGRRRAARRRRRRPRRPRQRASPRPKPRAPRRPRWAAQAFGHLRARAKRPTAVLRPRRLAEDRRRGRVGRRRRGGGEQAREGGGGLQAQDREGSSPPDALALACGRSQCPALLHRATARSSTPPTRCSSR